MPIKPGSPNWIQIGDTPHTWEAEALTYLREGLDDSEPTRVWTLFEFVSKEGLLNEVDALVLTRKGFFFVEDGACDDGALREWVSLAMSHAMSLPPK